GPRDGAGVECASHHGSARESPEPCSQPVMSPAPLEPTSTPGFYRRGDRYAVRFRDPSGRVRQRTARTLAEARTLRASLLGDVARGEFRAQSKVTFSEYTRVWVETYTGRTSRGIRPETVGEYRAELERRAIPYFGERRLSEIEPRDVKTYIAALAAGLELKGR